MEIGLRIITLVLNTDLKVKWATTTFLNVRATAVSYDTALSLYRL
jgi:hypothetical protein